MTGQTLDYQRFAGGRGRAFGGRGGLSGATPPRISDGSGSRTPAGVPQGGRTPAWGGSSKSKLFDWFFLKRGSLTMRSTSLVWRSYPIYKNTNVAPGCLWQSYTCL